MISWRRISWVGAGLLAAGMMGAWNWREHQNSLRLGRELERLRVASQQRPQWQKKNAELRLAIERQPNLPTLNRQKHKLDQEEYSTYLLRVEEFRLQKALGLPAEAVWPPEQIWGEPVRSAEEWTDVGQATPVATLESVLWASRGGEVGRLGQLLNLDGAARQAAAELYASLPSEAKSEYGTPEQLVATVVSAEMPDDYTAFAIMPITDGKSPTTALIARVEDASGDQSDLALSFEHSASGWKMNVPAKTVQRFAAALAAKPAKEEASSKEIADAPR